ncbi:MAG: hypothetical protein JXR95_04025 [Deltaproteobacteria bacterium]|nr:hypothetical protein [Deltaproteobacteria bacterium]
MKFTIILIFFFVSGCGKNVNKVIDSKIPDGYQRMIIEIKPVFSSSRITDDTEIIKNRFIHIGKFKNVNVTEDKLIFDLKNDFPRHLLLKIVKPLLRQRGIIQLHNHQSLKIPENIRLPGGFFKSVSCGNNILEGTKIAFLKKIMKENFGQYSNLYLFNFPKGDREFSQLATQLHQLSDGISYKEEAYNSISTTEKGHFAIVLDGNIIATCLTGKTLKIIDQRKKFPKPAFEAILKFRPLSSEWKTGTIQSKYGN